MKEFLEKIIERLSKQGAESDLIFSSVKSFKMSAQKGEISEYKVSSSQILGVRAIKNGRVGISFSESLDEDSIDFMIKQSLQNAENSNENPHEKILKQSGFVDDSAVYDEEEIKLSTKIQKTLELESIVKNSDALVTGVPHNSYSENELLTFYFNSQGRITRYQDKTFSISTSALMDKNGKKANFYDFHKAHRFRDLNWDKVTSNSLFHARNLLSERPLQTGRYDVFFSEDCLQALLNCFSNFLSGKSAMDQMNPWSSHLDQKVASKDLCIQDVPQYDGSFRKSIFDSEGMEQKPLTLIDEGTLKSFYHNSVTANYFKTSSTGHAFRGPSGSIGISGTNLVISGKNVKPISPKYIEVIQMDGLYSSANRVNGNFSVAIKGYLWESRMRTITVGNCTLSGNFNELLKNVEVTGLSIASSTDGTFFSVPLIFKELSIAGV